MKQFYSGTPYIPKEIMLQYAVEDAAVIEDWLTKKRGQKVVLRVPQKGMKEKLVELAEKKDVYKRQACSGTTLDGI